MQKQGFGVFQIASAYIGTVIGAGFASGQEVLQFFVAFGLNGLWGILISSALFFFIGWSILLLGRSLGAGSHVDVVRFTNGPVLGTFIDIVITIFLFGGLSAMIAGAGAIFKEQFNVAPVWGTIVMALAALLTVVTGTRGVIRANSYIVPFLITAMLAVSIVSLARNPLTAEEAQAAENLTAATPNWPLSAVNYASYNIVISIGVLAPMGAATPDKKKLLLGTLTGAMGLTAALVAIYLCVLTNITAVGGRELPMVTAAGGLSGIIRLIFAVVLFAAVYTTAVGNLFALSQRTSLGLPRPMFIIGASSLALIAGQLGFSNMVRFLYPAVGYGGMAFFAGVIYVWIAKRGALWNAQPGLPRSAPMVKRQRTPEVSK